jgi:hypothetical protein
LTLNRQSQANPQLTREAEPSLEVTMVFVGVQNDSWGAPAG